MGNLINRGTTTLQILEEGLSNVGPSQPTATAYWLHTNNTKQICGFDVKPNSILLSAATATTETLIITASAKCKWTVKSESPWITVESGAAGQGAGKVTLKIAANAATTGRVATALRRKSSSSYYAARQLTDTNELMTTQWLEWR